MQPEAMGGVQRLARLWYRKEMRVRFLALFGGLGIVVTIAAFRGAISNLDLVGYPGVLFLSFLGSGSMILPVPGLISACGVSLLLSPIIVGLMVGIGETLGELSGYAVGVGSSGMLEGRGFYTKTKEWMERRGTLVLFLVSVIPNPVFDVVGIAAGSTRFPLPRFLATVWVGKTLKGLIVGYACFHGVDLLPWVD
jgi:membrane protein YqaA with SNARE-associated domain